MESSTKQACPRCGGCGRITGIGRQEQPWSGFRGVPPHLALEKVLGMRAPSPCPDCAGHGEIQRTVAREVR